jgi:hypothetical protein
MKYCKAALLFLCIVVVVAGLGWAQSPKEEYLRAYVNLIGEDLRMIKREIVDRAMGLEGAENEQFWAIYADYQSALDPMWDERIVNIAKFAEHFDSMTDEVADQLAVKMMELEGQRASHRNRYYDLFKQRLGARTAARFLQVETTLALIVDLQIASEVPIID